MTQTADTRANLIAFLTGFAVTALILIIRRKRP